MQVNNAGFLSTVISGAVASAIIVIFCDAEQPLVLLVILSVYKPAFVTTTFRFVFDPDIVPFVVLHKELKFTMLVLPSKVIEGVVQVITDGAAMFASAGVRPSATVIDRLLIHPVTGCVAVSE